MQLFGVLSLQVKQDISQGTQYFGEVPIITKLLMQLVEKMQVPFKI